MMALLQVFYQQKLTPNPVCSLVHLGQPEQRTNTG